MLFLCVPPPAPPVSLALPGYKHPPPPPHTHLISWVEVTPWLLGRMVHRSILMMIMRVNCLARGISQRIPNTFKSIYPISMAQQQLFFCTLGVLSVLRFIVSYFNGALTDSLSQSHGRTHSLNQSQGRVHSLNQSQGRVHSLNQSQGRAHSLNQSQGRTHPLNQSQGRTHPLNQSQGRTHPLNQTQEGLNLSTIHRAGLIPSNNHTAKRQP